MHRTPRSSSFFSVACDLSINMHDRDGYIQSRHPVCNRLFLLKGCYLWIRTLDDVIRLGVRANIPPKPLSRNSGRIVRLLKRFRLPKRDS